MDNNNKNNIQEQSENISEIAENSSAADKSSTDEFSEISKFPEINPLEEQVFTKRDILKMILGGYLALLPAFIAIMLTFLIIFLLARFAF